MEYVSMTVFGPSANAYLCLFYRAEKKLVKPMSANFWLLLNLSRIPERDLQGIVRNLVQGFESTGGFFVILSD
jgi:hypothetical protein